MNQIKIGKFISKLRNKKELTQEVLAEVLGVSKNAISKWERGINLPNVSIMENLCEILGISLNELFAGEYLEEKTLKKQAEKNILDILKFNNNKNKKYKFFIFIILILLIISVGKLGKMVLIEKGVIIDKKLAYSQEYISGTGNIKGDVNTKRYENISSDFLIGANKYGYAVFKNPDKAFERLKKDYSKGIKLIEKEFNLLPLSNFTYKIYGTYGWQTTTKNYEEKEEAIFVSMFMDIYENSFNRVYDDNFKLEITFIFLLPVIIIILGILEIYLFKKIKK